MLHAPISCVLLLQYAASLRQADVGERTQQSSAPLISRHLPGQSDSLDHRRPPAGLGLAGCAAAEPSQRSVQTLLPVCSSPSTWPIVMPCKDTRSSRRPLFRDASWLLGFVDLFRRSCEPVDALSVLSTHLSLSPAFIFPKRLRWNVVLRGPSSSILTTCHFEGLCPRMTRAASKLSLFCGGHHLYVLPGHASEQLRAVGEMRLRTGASRR